MDKLDEAIAQYIRDSLRINTRFEYGSYGSPDYVIISLELNGEKISEDYINMNK